MVSVIIPCFNNAPYIRRCVDSVLAQTYTDLEIIVVDDGSDDNPQQSLESVSDSRLRPVIQLPHGGVSKARNAGIEAAEGKYIIFIDGDDWVEPNHVEVLLNGLQKADCSMILMQIDYPNNSVEVNKWSKQLFAQSDIIEQKDFHILFDSFLLASPCNKIYKTRILKNTGVRFNDRVSYAEDTIFNLEYFSQIKSVSFNNIVTYHYIKYTASSSGRFHKNGAYTVAQISLHAGKCFKIVEPDTYRQFIRYVIWAISNNYHHNCPLSGMNKIKELRSLFQYVWFKESSQYIGEMGLNPLFAKLIKWRKPLLIHLLMSLRSHKN